MNLTKDFFIGYGFCALTGALYFVARYALFTYRWWRIGRAMRRALDDAVNQAGA